MNTQPGNISSSTQASQVVPDRTQKIHWAVSALEEKVDALRSRNWITEDLIQFSQKHWHCTREQALERLLAHKDN